MILFRRFAGHEVSLGRIEAFRGGVLAVAATFPPARGVVRAHALSP